MYIEINKLNVGWENPKKNIRFCPMPIGILQENKIVF
jgi:hypothetical protein